MLKISLIFITILIALPFKVKADPIPFRDMNNIEKIDVDGKILSFISKNGVVKFDTLNQSWTLVKKNRFGPLNHFVFPEWVPPSFRNIKEQFTFNQNRYWLTSTVSEGSTYIDDVIIDDSNRIIYRIPFQDSQTLAVEADNIWIGHRRGVTKINRISRQRIDYEFLPKFEKITGWDKFKDSYLISTSDGKLFSFNEKSREIKSVPFSRYSFDSLFPTVKSKTLYKKARYHFTNPIVRGDSLIMGVIPMDQNNKRALGQSGIMTFNINNIEQSATAKNLDFYRIQNSGKAMGIKKLVKIKGDIFLLGNHREFYEGGDFSEFGGVVIINEHGRQFDLHECGYKPVVAIKTGENNTVSILQQSINPKTDTFTYFECTMILNEPNENVSVSEKLKKVTHSVRVLDHVKLLKNDPKINEYQFLKFELIPEESTELVKYWKVNPKLKVYYNRPIKVKDYHSPMHQETDGILYPARSQKLLNLN